MTTWKTAAGREIDQAEAERMAAAFEADDEAIAQAVKQPARRRGRPSLQGGQGQRSPKVALRMSKALHSQLQETAKRESRPVSAVARDAVAAYVESHPGP